MKGLNQQLIWHDKDKRYCNRCKVLLADTVKTAIKTIPDGKRKVVKTFYCDRCMPVKKMN